MLDAARDAARHRSERSFRPLAPPVIAAAAVTLALVLGWKGADWPAQVYRVQLFRSYGWLGVDTGWYGGNYPLAYSALYPPLAAALSVGVVAASSAAVSAWAFDRLMAAHLARRGGLGSMVFATGTVVPVAIGQLPFLLGVAFGLLAVLSMRRRVWLSVVAALTCALTSPVAGLFLGLAAGVAAVTSSNRRRQSLLVAAAATAPVLGVTVVYHQGGLFPFRAPSLVFLLVACAAAWLVIPREHRTLRLGAVIYAALAVAVFAVPTPVGGLVTRLGATIGVPVMAAAILPLRRVIGVALLVPLLLWQWAPAVEAITTSGLDTSSHASYFQPLLQALQQAHAMPGRLEIPLTRDHWEAAWVAPTMPLAHGWERQLDMVDNPLFYAPGALTPAAYHAWLDANGIGWIALPDVMPDFSAVGEVALLRGRLPYVRPVWRGAHWTLWQVVDSPGLVTGPARMVSLTAGHFVLAAEGPGDVTVRVRYSQLWAIDGGGACLSPADGGWTLVRVTEPGTVEVDAGMWPRSEDRCG